MGVRVYEKALHCLRLIPFLLALGGSATALATPSEGTPDQPIRIDSYELGRGLALGDAGLTLGGYATTRYEDLRGDSTRMTLDHLSLMLWWEGSGRLSFFSETDLEEGLATRRQGDEDDRFVALERLYLDYAFADAATLRLGKFLTPIGRWNLVHADPLVWTTSRPMVTDEVFPASATGAMLLGTVPVARHDIDYALFASSGTAWRPKPAEDPFEEVRGLHLDAALGSGLRVGLSMAEFEQEAERDERKRLFGLDVLWRRDNWELTGEGVYRSSSDGAARIVKGGFLQLVAPLGERLFGVGRIEALRLADSDRTSTAWVAGLNFRYRRAISLKAEVLGGQHLPDGSPEGFLASLSVLF
ncbi:MAG: hypothetical protein KDG55_00240 [Rhodocyclaceae bacterium]|nr:hypothetical protein [Rhodocyclaceae bacterium]